MKNDNEKTSFSSYGIQFQEKLVKIMVLDRSFCERMREVMPVSFLEPLYLQTFVEKLYDYTDKYGVHPSLDTLTTMIRTQESDNNNVNKQVIEYFSRILSSKDLPEGSDYIKEQSVDFCKKQKLKEAFLAAIPLMNKSSFDEINKLISSALILGTDSDMGYEYIKDFEERYLPQYRDPVSTGWSEIDTILQGGLGKKELGVVIAPTGAGKSMVLVHLGASALLQGINVVHYTLELQETVIGKRYDSCITKFTLNELGRFKNEVFDQIGQVKGRLIIKEYPTKGATVITIRNHLEKMKRRGINVGMIIVDYADLLASVKSYEQKRFDLESIYEDLRGLAKIFNCPVYTASQTNRCFFENTLLYTREGDKIFETEINKIKIGSEVETQVGWKKVIDINKNYQKLFKIKLKSGKEIICSEKHMFPVIDGNFKSIETGLEKGSGLFVKK
ncbi:AAA family ATPase [Candidatus Pacearchaeota archaeon]|nr:AAA family ATPase [Candidatus Pacearchaeota archaeon]